MIALVRYTLSTVLLSQRYLPPVLVFLAGLLVFTGADDNGPLLPDYAVGTAGVFICGIWLTVVTINAPDPVQRSITVVNGGGSGRVLAASVWVAALWCAFIGVIGLLYPLTVGHHPVDPAVLVLGALAELTSACTGIALGLLCSRLVVRRTGISILAALAAVLLFVLVPGVPPVHPVFQLLAAARPASAILWQVVLFSLVSVALLAASTMCTRFVADRRD
ncbi:MAG TPA: hypothetical protein VFX16_04965 [Pseudonocardiaceae bacterium]|nr:hypothetical protein [Pseudonocardiaceae bacterium]